VKNYHAIFLTHNIVLHVISNHIKLCLTEIPDKKKPKKIRQWNHHSSLSIIFMQSFLSEKERHQESKLAERTAKLNGSEVKLKTR